MTPSEAESSPSSPLRRLYDLVLAEAETKRGPAVLAVVSFTESSFFPIPPDPLLIALGIGSPRRAIPLALLTTVMSVLGGILGYFIGAWMMESIGNSIISFFHAEQRFEQLVVQFHGIGFLAILTAAVTPLPYKIFTIAAGSAGIPLPVFVTASLIGRGVRFLAQGILVHFYGARIQQFIDRWFGLVTILALVLGVLGFLALGSF
ncbi:MAG: VTT domain-containing protein [Planctomycetota bacterium]|nr:VTT domain-containing protein [Planctomycetota bacterium]